MPAKQKVFFDTNVVVYQFDGSSPTKRDRARELIRGHIHDGDGVISSQVVQEFMDVALKKFQKPMTAFELEAVLADMLQPLCAHTPSVAFYARALRLYAADTISFYDALIIQAAIDLECAVLYSEDLQAGRAFGMLTIENPFSEP